MNHLPYPSNPAIPLVEIPYMCRDFDKYDGQGFVDFPVRCGWAQAVDSFQWTDCPWLIAAKRAQSWLYFGLLKDMFDEDYHVDDFFRPHPSVSGDLIDTSKLPGLICHWSYCVREGRAKPWNTRVASRMSFLSRSHNIFREVQMQSEFLDRTFHECRIITLGIKVLLQSLQRAVSDFDDKSGPDYMSFDTILPARFSFLSMLDSGWCPPQTTNLVANYTVIMSNYLAALPRKFLGNSHKDCNGGVCMINNVDIRNYTTGHVHSTCQCLSQQADITDLKRILNDGHVPLISLEVTHDGFPKIKVVKASLAVQYTAISHVWSGGLGNFTHNALPNCQLLRLHILLNKHQRY